MFTPSTTFVFTEIPQPTVSWCKVDVVISKQEHITVVKDLPPPPLVVMTISLRTVLNQTTHQNEVRLCFKY